MTMAKRCVTLLAGLALMTSAVGCCCSHLGRSQCNPCSPCGPSFYPPGGGMGFGQGYGSTAYSGMYGQTAYVGDPAVMTASPGMPGSTFTTTTALAPINSLPTY